MAKFVNAFFNSLDQLKDKKRHPKWAQINVAAEVPGWTRFKPAQEWLDGKRREFNDQSQTSSIDNAVFGQFLADYKKKAGGPGPKEVSEAEIAHLKRLFDKWLAERGSAGTGGCKPTRQERKTLISDTRVTQWLWPRRKFSLSSANMRRRRTTGQMFLASL